MIILFRFVARHFFDIFCTIDIHFNTIIVEKNVLIQNGGLKFVWDLKVGCQSCFCGYVVNKLCNYIETRVKRIMLLLLTNVYFYKKSVD